jgi:membrane-associated phospholipid phosphatase
MTQAFGRIGLAFGLLVGMLSPALAFEPAQVLDRWARLSLELVRHTPTHSPPVASRSFAYLGVTAWEAAVATDPALVTLAGQLTDLDALPKAPAGLDPAVVMQSALAPVMAELFAHTGPTGQRALAAMTRKLDERVAEGLDPAVVASSRAYGAELAAAILIWARQDGGAEVVNMGFPMDWSPSTGTGRWVPTNRVVQQQAPLLPLWGQNRPFAMLPGDTCGLPSPTAWSGHKDSPFYRDALEVAEVTKSLTPEQIAIARFWADDVMLSSTPPGHWVAIALDLLDEQDAPVDRRAEVLARLGVALADAFIGCWDAKFRYDLVRPITYIRGEIDPKFEPLLNTPPFPEYPSGHSVQSGAAEIVMARMFGTEFAFTDNTKADDGLPARSFLSFRAAAEEAGISRLYGGIHFRPAIEDGLDMGRCIGDYAAALVMR